VRLVGRFWHKRADVLARVENYVLTRIPEAIEVQIEDPSQLDGHDFPLHCVCVCLFVCLLFLSLSSAVFSQCLSVFGTIELPADEWDTFYQHVPFPHTRRVPHDYCVNLSTRLPAGNLRIYVNLTLFS
jgi:hypothetical protein